MKRNGVGWPHTQIGNALLWRTAAFEYIEHEEVHIAVVLNATCEDEPAHYRHWETSIVDVDPSTFASAEDQYRLLMEPFP